MFPVLCVDDAPRERGRPARTMPRHSLGHLRHSDRPGTAPGVSLGLAVEVHTDRLAACQVALTLSDLHKGKRNKDAGGTPALPGGSLTSDGVGGRPGRRRGSIFFYEHRCTGCTGFFQETASLYSWESAIPHRTIARAGFRCNNLSSCLSCLSCASMLIIRLVATRAVEAAPSRFVALRVLLIVTYGTPRLPPSGSTAGSALSPTPPQGGSDS